MASYALLDKQEHELQSFPPQLSPSDPETTTFQPSLPYVSDPHSAGARSSSTTAFLSPLRRSMFHNDPPPPPLSTARRMRTGIGSVPAWTPAYDLIKALVLPLIAIAYLSFCYTVHQKVVPVSTYGWYSIVPEHLAAIKAGITSISIIVISVALWPLTDLLQDLKSEEFFRFLSTHPHGASLASVNGISLPSFGAVQSTLAMARRQCSRYFFFAAVASVFSIVTSTMAPAALTIQSVLSDGDIQAFAVGSIGINSVWNLSSTGLYASSAVTDNEETASAIVWAEMELGVTYAFSAYPSSSSSSSDSQSDDYTAYIVPTPPALPKSATARWLTDVVGVRPACAWASTNLTGSEGGTTTVNGSFSDFDLGTGPLVGVQLMGMGLDVGVPGGVAPLTQTDSTNALIYDLDPYTALVNHSTGAPPTDGSSVWMVGQCTAGCEALNSSASGLLDIDFSNSNSSGGGEIPHYSVKGRDQTWTLAFLACRPNAAVETREVRSDGLGGIAVQPPSPPSSGAATGKGGGGQMPRQGNLHPAQSASLFSLALSQIGSAAGPTSTLLYQYGGLGSLTQAHFVFGKDAVDALPSGYGGTGSGAGQPRSIKPLGEAELSTTYGKMVVGAAKTYTSGKLGTAYVPGRISSPRLVFASSLPHVVVSTLMFVFLSAIVVVAHFRRGRDAQFTLVNVAAALHGSDLPARCAQLKAGRAGGAGGNDGDDEERGLGDNSRDVKGDVVEMLGERSLVLESHDEGPGTLHLTCA